MHPSLIWAAFLTVALGAGDAARAEADAPVLVVLLLATDDAARAREQRFVSELKLALDGFVVVVEEIDGEEFRRLPLPEQLDRIRPITERPGVVATTWLWERGSGYTFLHLVALSTGRAIVRIVEAEQGPNTEEHLALSARELLGEAYLFDPPPAGGQLDRIVGEVQDRVARRPSTPVEDPDDAAEPVPLPAKSEPMRIGLMPFVTAGTGVYGHRGPSTTLGGGLAGEWRPTPGFFVQLSVAGFGGPWADTRDGQVRGGRLSPRLAAGYGWTIGPLLVGPLIEGSLRWTILRMELGAGDLQTFNRLRTRAGAGLDLRWSVADGLAIVAAATLGVVGRREAFDRESDESAVLTTPLLDFNAILGLMFSWQM